MKQELHLINSVGNEGGVGGGKKMHLAPLLSLISSAVTNRQKRSVTRPLTVNRSEPLSLHHSVIVSYNADEISIDLFFYMDRLRP